MFTGFKTWLNNYRKTRATARLKKQVNREQDKLYENIHELGVLNKRLAEAIQMREVTDREYKLQIAQLVKTIHDIRANIKDNKDSFNALYLSYIGLDCDDDAIENYIKGKQDESENEFEKLINGEDTLNKVIQGISNHKTK